MICDYFVVNGSEDEDSLGIWMVPASNDTKSIIGCEAYPSDMPVDSLFRTARAMSVLAPVFCFAGTTFSYFAETGSLEHQERRLLCSVFLLLLAAVTQGLTLMTLESDVCVANPKIPGDGSCGLSNGAIISIGAACAMATATFMLLVTGRKNIEQV